MLCCGFGTGTSWRCLSTTAGCDNDWQHLVGWFAHPVERHQGLLHGPGRDVLEAATARPTFSQSDGTRCSLSTSRLLVVGSSCRRAIRTTGRSASACIATSIPDRVIMVFEQRPSAGNCRGFFVWHRYSGSVVSGHSSHCPFSRAQADRAAREASLCRQDTFSGCEVRQCGGFLVN